MNTCFETTNFYHTIAFYSHLVPLAIAGCLALYALFKTRFSFLSKVFFFFVFTFCLWMLGDVIVWTSQNYNSVIFNWSLLDYINIVFFALAFYFYWVLLFRKDLPLVPKIILLLITLPGLYWTTMGQSIFEFYHPDCEAVENEFLTQYKLYTSLTIMAGILITGIYKFVKERETRALNVVVGFALLLFLSVFGVTEYIATQTDIYEINLYGLFITPLFLMLITYAILNLQVFKLRLFGTQLLVYILVITIASQFLFLENSTDAALNGVTLLLVLFFSFLLSKNVKREVQQREQIERLAVDLQRANDRLKELDRQKTEFVSFATHQLRSPLTAMKGYAANLIDGDYGDLPEKAKESVKVIFESANTLASVVEDYLNISRIELGTMKYVFADADFKQMVDEAIGDIKPNIEKSGLSFSFEAQPGNYTISADVPKLKQVILNIIDNSSKYTPKGSIDVSLGRVGGKFLLSVKDTGIGIHPEVLPKLFNKFTRAGTASNVNIRGTGLGLYIAKQMVEAHGGRVWAESPGDGKGSTFYIEVPAKS